MRAPPAVGYRDARMSVVIWSFIIVMILMTLAGASSIIRKTKTPEDYLVAGRDVAPWLREVIPVILIVYDAQRERAFWLHLAGHFKGKWKQLFSTTGSVTVRIPTKNRINKQSVLRFDAWRVASLA